MLGNSGLSVTVVLSVGDYAPIRSVYYQMIYGAMREYLYTEDAKITKYKNYFKRAINDQFYPAFEQGLKDGGSEPPLEPEDESWIQARIPQEWGFVDNLFASLRDFKKDSDASEWDAETSARAEGYCRTLDGVYSEGKVRGAKNKMLTFGGQSGKESCITCQKLMGQRHKASWWKNRGLIIERGNSNYECGCWQCQHLLFDDDGNVYTL